MIQKRNGIKLQWKLNHKTGRNENDCEVDVAPKKKKIKENKTKCVSLIDFTKLHLK